ncbi:hypothetical protein GCM10028805_30790 [Spirosoma harenae]
MNTQKHHPTLLKPEVLLRVMLDDNFEPAYPQSLLAPDTWIDFDTAFGPQYQSGTEHMLTLLNPPIQAINYRVAKTPILAQFRSKNGKLIPMAMIYMAPATSE